MTKRALISVSDKSGVLEFAKELVALGYEVLSTGGIISPSTFVLPSGCNPTIDVANVLLPQPDSPTIASTSFSFSVRLISSIAAKYSSLILKLVCRFLILSNSFDVFKIFPLSAQS